MVRRLIFLLICACPLLAKAQSVSISGSWAKETAKLRSNKTIDTGVMECVYN